MRARIEGKVRTYIDHRNLGTGYRTFIAFNKTKKKVRLLDVATLRTASVYLVPKRTAKGTVWGLRNPSTSWYLDYDKAEEAKRIDGQRRYYTRLSKKAVREGRAEIPYSNAAAKAVVRALREAG